MKDDDEEVDMGLASAEVGSPRDLTDSLQVRACGKIPSGNTWIPGCLHGSTLRLVWGT